MIEQLSDAKRHMRKRLLTLGLASMSMGLVAGLSAITSPALPAQAHCDAVTGPVVTAAREALETDDVDLVLPYVQPKAEAELTAAFDQTMAVRTSGGAAQDLADQWFFETAVRLHRAGEGASYTGLSEQTDFGPALEAAEAALESESLDEVSTVLQQAIEEGLATRYAQVEEARQHAEEAPSVAAERERVESELAFEQYVDAIYQAMQGQPTTGEGSHAAASETVTAATSDQA